MLSIKERKELHDMSYVTVDWSWVEEQLSQIGASGTPVGDAVFSLLAVLEQQKVPQNRVQDIDRVLELVSTLIKGHPVVSDSDSDSWVDLRGGDLSVRDTVRVKPNAYSGKAGIDNNGRRGRVTSMRSGKITVVFDGDPVENAKGHDISLLQKLAVE